MNEIEELQARITELEASVNGVNEQYDAALDTVIQQAARITELEKALELGRQLKRLLPICAHCKKIRDDADYWHEIESYIHAQTGTDFTHGICPACMEKVMREELGKKTVEIGEEPRKGSDSGGSKRAER